MTPPLAIRLSRLAAPLLVFAVAAWTMLGQAQRVGYNTDEGQFISTAEYFDVVFLQGRLAGAPWDITYWTLTQPPITRYLLGAAIHLSGNPIPRMNLDHRIEEARGPDRERFLDPAYYRDERRLAEERRINRPPAAVLHAARVPMAIFGAGAGLLLFLIGRSLGGTVAGLVAAAGLLWTPLALQLLPRAHAEGPLIFLSLLGLLLSLLATRRATRDAVRASTATALDVRGPNVTAYTHDRPARGLPAWLALWSLAGLATGLAAGTKLTAVLAIAALGGFTAWAFLVWWRSRDPLPRSLAARAWRGGAVASALSLIVFVGVNPFMWPNPVDRTLAMLQFRRQEVVGQRALNAELAVPESLPTRVALLLSETFVAQMPLSRRTGLPIEAGLALVGAIVLVRRALIARARGGLVGPEAVVLAWVVVFLGGTAPNLGIDWDRYYLPTLTLGLVLVGVGAGTLADASAKAWRQSRSPARQPDPERSPAAASS